MTIVAWDGSTLAADRRLCRGGLISTGRKIFRVDSRLVGFAGGSDFCAQTLAWFKSGAKPDDWKDLGDDNYVCSLVIEADGRIVTFDRTPFGVEHFDKCAAIGSGREIAIGAMAYGATAMEAVMIASEWMDDCGNGVDFLELGA